MSGVSFLPALAPTQILFAAGLPKSIGSILIDAFIEEDHHSAVTVTDYPVEDGSTISDNAVEQPDELRITGICGPGSLLLNPVTTLSRVVNAISSGSIAPLDIDQALYQLKSARQPVIVVTGLRVYQNMVIEDYRVQRNKDNGGSLPFVMLLRQVKIVKSQSTTVPASQLGGSTGAQQQTQENLAAGNAATVQPPDSVKTTVQADIIGNFNAGLQGQPGKGTF